MFEEQRQFGGRPYQRTGFRGGFRGNDRRAIATSPNSYTDGRHTRSSSSGGLTGGNSGRPRYSRSRSRSFTGSSSRSISNSGRSASASPHLRRMPPHNPTGSARGLPDGQPTQFADRRIPRNQSYRSVSGSSSSSRSSPGLHMRHNSAGMHLPPQKSHPSRFQHGRGGASPLTYSHGRRDKPISGSPEQNAPDYASFANAPAPDVDGGSSLVSGLIQLKRRNQPDAQESRLPRNRQASIGSSSSGFSGGSPRGALDPTLNSGRRRGLEKRLSVSPPFGESVQRNYKPRNDGLGQSTLDNEDRPDFPKRKRQKQMENSPGSFSPTAVRSSYVDPSKSSYFQDPSGRRQTSLDRSVASRQTTRDNTAKSNRTVNDISPSPEIPKDSIARRPVHQSPSEDPLWRAGNSRPGEADSWSRSSRRSVDKNRKSVKCAEESAERQSTDSDIEEGSAAIRKQSKLSNPKKSDVEQREESTEASKDKDNLPDETSDDSFDLIRQRKESLAQDYKRDCEAFTAVVRTLISKDAELEGRLMPMLKEILHERGQRCIEELRTFIAERQPESDPKTELTEVPVV